MRQRVVVRIRNLRRRRARERGLDDLRKLYIKNRKKYYHTSPPVTLKADPDDYPEYDRTRWASILDRFACSKFGSNGPDVNKNNKFFHDKIIYNHILAQDGILSYPLKLRHIFYAISKLVPTKAAGDDDVPPEWLKELPPVVIFRLLGIFN